MPKLDSAKLDCDAVGVPEPQDIVTGGLRGHADCAQFAGDGLPVESGDADAEIAAVARQRRDHRGARHVLRGIGDYERVHGPWLFHISTDMAVHGVPSRDEWDGDGIIAQPHQNVATPPARIARPFKTR
mgnify:CR=1 FL=1